MDLKTKLGIKTIEDLMVILDSIGIMNSLSKKFWSRKERSEKISYYIRFQVCICRESNEHSCADVMLYRL